MDFLEEEYIRQCREKEEKKLGLELYKADPWFNYLYHYECYNKWLIWIRKQEINTKAFRLTNRN